MTQVLFVCSGNTCRSPMAAAIANHFCRATLPDLSAMSAGVSAAPGSPMSADAIVALGERGVPHRHRSQRLTRDLIAQSDLVLVMERRHLVVAEALAGELEPHNRPQIALLEEDAEVPDPIGLGLPTYRALAQRLVEVVPQRLAALGPVHKLPAR